jgi:hypothetical protein
MQGSRSWRSQVFLSKGTTCTNARDTSSNTPMKPPAASGARGLLPIR